MSEEHDALMDSTRLVPVIEVPPEQTQASLRKLLREAHERTQQLVNANAILQREYAIETERSDRRRRIHAIQETALELVSTMAVKLDGVPGTTSARYWISQHTLDTVKDTLRRSAKIETSTSRISADIDQAKGATA